MLERRGRRQCFAAQRRSERLALQELGNDEGSPGMAADVVDYQDFWMVERPCCAHFLFEATEPLEVHREALRQDLDRDITADAQVAGTVDFAHPSRADQAHDLVSTDQSAGRERVFIPCGGFE